MRRISVSIFLVLYLLLTSTLLIASILVPITINGDIYVSTNKDVYPVGEVVEIEVGMNIGVRCLCYGHDWYVYVAKIENELCATYVVKEWWWNAVYDPDFSGKKLYWKASEKGDYEVVANLITHKSSALKRIQIISSSSPQSSQRLLKVSKVYASPSNIRPGTSSTLYYEFQAIESGYVDKFILYIYVDTPQGLRLLTSEILLEGKGIIEGQIWVGNTWFSIPYDALPGSVIAVFYNAPTIFVPIYIVTELPSNVEIFSVARVEVVIVNEWKRVYEELKDQYDGLLRDYNDMKSSYDEVNRRYGELLDRYQDLSSENEEVKSQLAVSTAELREARNQIWALLVILAFSGMAIALACIYLVRTTKRHPNIT